MKFTTSLVLFFALFFITNQSYCQTDSTQYVSYDIVSLKSGGILKGEILSFNEETGLIVFRDTTGKKYSFAKEDYNYFEEDKRYPVKNKNKDIKPRKEEEFEITVGFNGAFVNVINNFQVDDYFLFGSGSSDLPICLRVGVGKYFTRNHYIGLASDIPIMSYRGYFNVGLRYSYQYDAFKRNVAFYIPVEVMYNQIKNNENFTINDTLFSSPTNYITPIYDNLDFTTSGVGLSVGQGFSFIMNNKKSISLELSLLKFFMVSHKYTNNTHGREPNSSFGAHGFRFSLLYNI